MSIIYNSPTIIKYKNTLKECIKMYYPIMDDIDIDKALNYSISKRYYSSRASINNSYTNKIHDVTKQEDKSLREKTLLDISDYILSKEPIVTAFGTMFRKHSDLPNPLAQVVQSFLDNRSKHKKLMFKYPKGHEMFERYNLLQSLSI